jgi:hypothetical protein
MNWSFVDVNYATDEELYSAGTYRRKMDILHGIYGLFHMCVVIVSGIEIGNS